jgi:hypothetical protein
VDPQPVHHHHPALEPAPDRARPALEGFWNWLQSTLAELTSAKAFIACAAGGGAVLVGQLALGMLGVGGGDHDADVDASLEDGEGLGLLSVRTIAGFFTFFGLVGWLGVANRWPMPVTIGAASLSGLSVMFAVAWIMRSFRRLNADGNVDPDAAIGHTAQVYLRIPARKQGRGKITLPLQGRTVEFAAVTDGDELPTGSTCRIVARTTGDLFVVESIREGAKS